MSAMIRKQSSLRSLRQTSIELAKLFKTPLFIVLAFHFLNIVSILLKPYALLATPTLVNTLLEWFDTPQLLFKDLRNL